MAGGECRDPCWIVRHRLLVAGLVFVVLGGLLSGGVYWHISRCGDLLNCTPGGLSGAGGYGGYGHYDSSAALPLTAPADSVGLYPSSQEMEALNYNAKLANKNAADPHAVVDGQQTDVEFFIGPQDARNILDQPGLSAGAASLLSGSDLYIPLSISLVCLTCDDQSLQTKNIVYVNSANHSDSAHWAITPRTSYAKGGIGELKFIITYKGAVLDERRARVAFGKTKVAPVAQGDCQQNMVPGKADVTIYADLADQAVVLSVAVHDEALKEKLAGQSDDGWAVHKVRTAMTDQDARVSLPHRILKDFSQLENQPFQGMKADISQDPTLQAGANRLLTGVGSYFYDRLISKGDPRLAELFRVIEKYGSSRAAAMTPLHIVVVTTGRIDLPWQLLRAPGAPEGVDDFWGNKFVISAYPVLPGICGMPHSVIQAGAGNRLVYIGYRDPEQKYVTELSRSYGSELAHEWRLAGLSGEVYTDAKSSSDLQSYFSKNAQDVVLIAALTHGEGAEHYVEASDDMHFVQSKAGPVLKFSATSNLRADDIGQWALGYSAGNFFSGRPIVFLDGCWTGAASEARASGDSFPGVFLENGARVVVATTAPVVSELGADFGRKFIQKLKNGNKVAEAVYLARKDQLLLYRNPLGLLFSVYGVGDTRLLFKPSQYYSGAIDAASSGPYGYSSGPGYGSGYGSTYGSSYGSSYGGN